VQAMGQVDFDDLQGEASYSGSRAYNLGGDDRRGAEGAP
jgi:hypothetical protein